MAKDAKQQGSIPHNRSHKTSRQAKHDMSGEDYSNDMLYGRSGIERDGAHRSKSTPDRRQSSEN